MVNLSAKAARQRPGTTTWVVPEVAAAATTGEPAVFTTGAYTVRVTGPARTFSESNFGVTSTVVTDAWVHVLPAPFDGTVDADDQAWLDARVAEDAAGAPDVLAMLHQYIAGAPDVHDGALRIAGDAGYGDAAGADFNDFLQIDWSYPAEGRDDPWDVVDAGNLDCSGYTRIVFGYRGGLPMSWDPMGGATLPRQSKSQYSDGTGVLVIPRNKNRAVAATDYPKLKAGDLVFFDASGGDGVIDHVGVFLGVDTAGNYRMINSRNSMHGPTMRDGAGSAYGESGQPSIVNGGGLYSTSFRGARRL